MGDVTENGHREEEALYLVFTHAFLRDALGRQELAPLTFSVLTRRINHRLGQLGYLGFAPEPWQPAVGGAAAGPQPQPVTPGPTPAAQPLPGTAPVAQPGASIPAMPWTSPAVSGQQLGMTWLLYLGAFFLFMAAVTFTAFGWQSFSDEIKFIVIGLYTMILYGLGALADRAKLTQAGYTFFWLATATLPIALGAFASFILDLRMFNPQARVGVGNEWLAFVLLGCGAAAVGLYAWKRLHAFRHISLLSLALCPVAYFMESADLLPVIPAVMALAQTAAGRTVEDEGWSKAAGTASVVSAALAILLGVVPIAGHLLREISLVQNVGRDLFREAGLDTVKATPFLSVALLAGTFWLWRKSSWWDTRAPEAFSVSLLSVLAFTSFGFGRLAPGAGLLYLGMLGVTTVYVAFRRNEDAIAAGLPAALMLLALTPGAVYLKALSPRELPFDANGLLAGLAFITLGLLFWDAARAAGWGTPDTVQALSFFAVPGAYLTLTACFGAELPVTALIVTAACGGAVVWAVRRTMPWLCLSAAAGALVSWVAVLAWTVTVAPRIGPNAHWLPTAFYTIVLAAMLGVSGVKGLSRPSSLLVLVPGYLVVVELGLWRTWETHGVLFAFAVITYWWGAVYRLDMYAVLATAIASVGAIVWANDLIEWASAFAQHIDYGLASLMLLPAPVLAGLLWRTAADPVRQSMRSLAYFAIPMLALGAARATDWKEQFVLFVLVLVGGSGFAVAGFTKRIAGFATIGLVFVFWASFDFLVPFIRMIPSWVGFGLVGLLLVTLGVTWEHNKQFLRDKARTLAEGAWV